MRRLVAAFAIILSTAAAAHAQSLAGDWLGTLNVGPVALRLVLHVTAGSDGRLTATLDSIDQGAKGIPVSLIALKDSTMSLAVAVINGSYEGRVSADGNAIDGTWTQAGSLPLVFRRVKDASELVPKRPQNPVPPLPYREEDVTFANASANVTLAGTLTVPAGAGPFPAVVLISGSGPQDRDEALMGHRPFLVLADYLTRHGIAVLRADDRGVGKSTGNHKTATTVDFASDAEAGLGYLMSRAEVNKQKIGLVGHSEGGIIAPMVAARNPSVAFIVLLAGSGVPGDQILVAQSALIAQASGIPRDQVDQNTQTLRGLIEIIKNETDDAALHAKIREALTGKVPPSQIDLQVKTLTTPWFRYFLTYDPAAALRRVTTPVLAMNGEKDLQVPPKQNLDAIRAALKAGGNTRVEVIEMPGLNHLFQTAKTGSPIEYGLLEETIAPSALDKIATWIASQ
jgi:fermentation-respiration switch protein FrsA (DUF1100 family)